MNNYDGSNVLEIRNLTKIYDKVSVVNNISFDVKKGEVFGFLGPNGAGKTTTIKSILGLIHPNSGKIKINGFDLLEHKKEVNKNVGYLPEKVAFYNNLTALQNLNFYAEMKNVSRADCINLLIDIGLKESAHKKVGKFSTGMIQRLGIARASLGEPKIMILDEPTAGLDPRGVLKIREWIKKLNKKGVSFFISSHILSEIQAVCNKVGIINRGNIVALDKVDNLTDKLDIKPKIIIDLEKVIDNIIEKVKKLKGVERVEIFNNKIEVFCDPESRINVILTINKAGGKVLNIQTAEPSLEEVFMKYTE
jgi:ABC-type multidrug transport system ATPase subunit